MLPLIVCKVGLWVGFARKPQAMWGGGEIFVCLFIFCYMPRLSISLTHDIPSHRCAFCHQNEKPKLNLVRDI
jgi:hypothetical protein